MKSSALIFLFALVMASSARADSCTHPLAYPVGSPCGSATDFHVCASDITNPNFSPANGGYRTPVCVPPQPNLALFNQVYNLLNARRDIRTTLCTRLQHVFVLAGGSDDFGVWEVPAGALPGGPPNSRPVRAQGVMYIAVHPDANVGHNLAYQENKMLEAAFAPKPVPPGLEYLSDDAAGEGMALLSILAHELGHLLLAETNADGTGGHGRRHDRSDLCDTQQQRPNPETCFDDTFLALWDASTFHQHMRRWIDFRGRNHNQYQDSNHDLDRTTNYSHFLDGEFVSFDAAASPEEDLVETYKYMILADVAQRSNLRLRIPGLTNPVTVLDKVSGATAGSNLKRKIDCVKRLKPALN